MLIRLLTVILLAAAPSFAATWYVLPGGTVGCTGADWTNALGRIPNSTDLSDGDTIYVGYVADKDLGDETTNPSCPGDESVSWGTDSNITLKAATDADHGTETGWAASMSVDSNPGILWSSDGLLTTQGMLSFCGGGNTIDGQVGAFTDPSDPNETSYGLIMRNSGLGSAIVFNGTSCAADVNTFTVSNVWLDGVDVYATMEKWTGTVNISAGSTTVTRASGAAFTAALVNGKMRVNNLTRTVSGFTDGDTLTLSSSPCASACTGEDAYVDFPGGSGLYAFGISNHLNNISLTDVYISNWMTPIFWGGYTGNVFDGMELNRVYIEKNNSNAVNHSSLFNGYSNSANLNAHNSVFRNGVGTMAIGCIGYTGAGCADWRIHSNVIFWDTSHGTTCTADLGRGCEISKVIGDNGAGSSHMTGLLFYGNTIHCNGLSTNGNQGITITNGSSSTNHAGNNIWLNCPWVSALSTSLTHTYNTLINTTRATAAWILSTGEEEDSDYSAQAGTPPFTDEATYDYKLAVPTTAGETLSSPYNIDFLNNTRGADGSWDRGAYECIDDEAGGCEGSVPAGNPAWTSVVSTPANRRQGTQDGSFTVTVTNSGDAAANCTTSNCVISITPSSGMTLLTLTMSGASCNVGAGTCTDTTSTPAASADLPVVTATFGLSKAAATGIITASASGGGALSSTPGQATATVLAFSGMPTVAP